jgi:hypothetical protein
MFIITTYESKAATCVPIFNSALSLHFLDLPFLSKNGAAASGDRHADRSRRFGVKTRRTKRGGVDPWFTFACSCSARTFATCSS